MKEIIKLFEGKKTFIVGGLLILVGLIQSDEKIILEGIGFLTIRSGINSHLKNKKRSGIKNE